MRLRYIEVLSVLLFALITYYAYNIKSSRTTDCSNRGGVMIPSVGCIKKEVFITLVHEEKIQ